MRGVASLHPAWQLGRWREVGNTVEIELDNVIYPIPSKLTIAQLMESSLFQGVEMVQPKDIYTDIPLSLILK